jgi:UDP-N-acetylglucosamine acyltransferase
MPIHFSAIVDSRARIAPDVEIGPFCVVEHDTEIGPGTRLVAHASVRAGATLGSNNLVCEGAVLGGLPQHANPQLRPGRLVIGNDNVLREHVTMHRAMHENGTTILGDNCMLMVGAHVAHDCRVGNRVILTNGAMLGGHVEVGDRACLGGNSAVHQFCRVGRLTMIGGCTKVTQDVPPFVLADGSTALIIGLNRVGLKRAGLCSDEVVALKSAYRLIYRKGLPFDEMIATLEARFPQGVAGEFAEFFRGGQRGFVQERRSPPKAALRLHPAIDDFEAETTPAADAQELTRRAA